MTWWEIVITIILLNGTQASQKVERPKFHNKDVCKQYIELPQFKEKLIQKYWNGDDDVAYVIPKCKPIIEV